MASPADECEGRNQQINEVTLDSLLGPSLADIFVGYCAEDEPASISAKLMTPLPSLIRNSTVTAFIPL